MGYVILSIGYVLLIITAIIGWIMNIVQIAGMEFSNLTGIMVLKIVGIFVVPLGAILGLIG